MELSRLAHGKVADPFPTLGRQGPSLPDHAGQFYQDCLRIIHQTMRPEAYLEIGTLNGDTLALAKCAAIAIDPCFQVNQAIMGQKSSLFMFQTTSDEFFRSNRASAILGRPLDMAFLDGMHLFEYLLRDFSNTERCCATNRSLYCTTVSRSISTWQFALRTTRRHARFRATRCGGRATCGSLCVS